MTQTNNRLLDNAPHLLVVDDDTRIRNLLSQYLKRHHFRINVATSAVDARNKLKSIDFDLLVVDVMMPGESGLSLTKSLRAEKKVPILMLTALSETEQRIHGLEAGADDYLSKPFDPRELLLRIHAILRRGQTAAEQATIAQVVFGPYSYCTHKKELKKVGQIIHLTEREQEMMIIFSQHAGETVSRHDLSGTGDDVGERTIDVQVNRLRRKIEHDPTNPVWLQTVRGSGYKLAIK